MQTIMQQKIKILITIILLFSFSCQNKRGTKTLDNNVVELIESNDSLRRLQITNLNTFLNEPIDLQSFKKHSESSKDFYWTSSKSNCFDYFKKRFGEITCFDFTFASYDSTIIYDKPLKIFGKLRTIRINKGNPNFMNFIDTTEILISLNFSKNLEYACLDIVEKDTCDIKKLFGDYNQLNDSTISYSNGEFELELLHKKGLISSINWKRLK